VSKEGRENSKGNRPGEGRVCGTVNQGGRQQKEKKHMKEECRKTKTSERGNVRGGYQIKNKEVRRVGKSR